jgi:hypothetical protein
MIGVAACLLLAGCVAPTLTPNTTSSSPGLAKGGPFNDAATVVHNALGAILPRSANGALASHQWLVSGTGLQGGEPTIGIAKTGRVFVGGVGRNVSGPNGRLLPDPGEIVATTGDGGKTWTTIADRMQPPLDLDPWIWLDPGTQRLYVAPLYVVCDNLAWTDDAGASWSQNPIAACPLPGIDHQKLTSGPPAAGVSTSGYPNVLYYAYNDIRYQTTPPPSPTTNPLPPREGTAVSVSLDGGKSWQRPVVAHNATCNGGVNGPVAVGPDGTAYFAKGTCQGTDVVVSKDSGKTWAVVASFNDIGPYAPEVAYDPPVAIDAAGNVYVAAVGKDGNTYLRTSTDHGASWSASKLVTPPGTNSTAFLAIAVGAPGDVTVGTVSTQSPAWDTRAPSLAPNETVWHLWMTSTANALDANPVFTSERVSTSADPVQRGCIWLRGGVQDCRNLGDFIDMHALDGRPYLVYTDGCPRCDSAATSHQADVVVVTAEGGPSLLGGLLGPVPVAQSSPAASSLAADPLPGEVAGIDRAAIPG